MASSIYTRTGDDGTTGILGAERLPKDAPRLQALGSVDELNATLGLARVELAAELPGPAAERLDQTLAWLQHRLFDLGCRLATTGDGPTPNLPTVTADDVTQLERWIDGFEEDLTPLTNFILPGGGRNGAWLHYARGVCRRSERWVVTLRHDTTLPPEILGFLNRLADLLFVLARWATHQAGLDDVRWEPATR